jgi:hypothetical protein
MEMGFCITFFSFEEVELVIRILEHWPGKSGRIPGGKSAVCGFGCPE